MAILSLKQLSAEYARAVTAGDLDALCSFYTDDALFVPEPGGTPVAGNFAVRQVLAGFLAAHPTMEFEHTSVLQTGDTALARGRWKLTSAGPDGVATVVAGNSIEVLRRQEDGSWQYVIDDPWGGDK